MGKRVINRLDPVVSSQIAAGEVVERPASVVKELVENAIDAGATRIIIEVQNAGLDLIRVSDNGIGMSREDAALSVERFATSKLRTIDDLPGISTLGFRGEALPSIASCSAMTIHTRSQDEELGTEIVVEGGTVLSISDKGLPSGTTVTVTRLFYNTPARLKFLKSRQTERDAIVDAVERLALAWPDISFVLKSDHRTVLHTAGTGLRNALADIYGPDFSSAMIEVETHEEDGYAVSGFIGMPSNYRRQRDRQIFSVNQRPVRNQSLAWALDDAFLGLLPPKTYPVAVLNIRAKPGYVDVNVHPTKAEVRFKDERAVRRAVTESVSSALKRNGFMAAQIKDSASEDRRSTYERQPIQTALPGPRTFETLHLNRDIYMLPSAPRPLPVMDRLFQSESPPGSQARGADSPGCNNEETSWTYAGPLGDVYLVVNTRSSLLIIDKHALMESLTYHALCQGNTGTAELLMASTVNLGAKEALLYEEYEACLNDMGFRTRLVGHRTVLVSAVPVVLGQPVPPETLTEILALLESEHAGRGDALPEVKLARGRIALAACHASIRAGDPMSDEEAKELVEMFFRNPEARLCPHGRPTVREIPLQELDHFFGRSKARANQTQRTSRGE